MCMSDFIEKIKSIISIIGSQNYTLKRQIQNASTCCCGKQLHEVETDNEPTESM